MLDLIWLGHEKFVLRVRLHNQHAAAAWAARADRTFLALCLAHEGERTLAQQ